MSRINRRAFDFVTACAALFAAGSIAHATFLLPIWKCSGTCVATIECTGTEGACCCKARTAAATWTCLCKPADGCVNSTTELCKDPND